MGIINYIYEWFCLNILSFDRYICVSNYTKNSLRLMYGISDDKLITVYNGIDYNFWNPSHIDEDHINALKKKYNLNDSYI